MMRIFQLYRYELVNHTTQYAIYRRLQLEYLIIYNELRHNLQNLVPSIVQRLHDRLRGTAKQLHSLKDQLQHIAMNVERELEKLQDFEDTDLDLDEDTTLGDQQALLATRYIMDEDN